MEEGGKEEEEQEEGTTMTRFGENSELFRCHVCKISNLEESNRFYIIKGRCEGTSTIDNVAEGHLEAIGARQENKR